METTFTETTNIVKLEWRDGSSYYFRRQNQLGTIIGKVERIKLNWDECRRVQMSKVISFKKAVKYGQVRKQLTMSQQLKKCDDHVDA